jgi:nitrate/nitrite transporter NarK
MMLKNKKQKINLRLLFLSIVYLVVCCFIFFFIASVGIDLIFDGKVNLTREVIIDVIVVSTIAGTAGGLGSWLFAKIDERKARACKLNCVIACF